MFHLTSVSAFVFRAPVETPVQTSFGLMRDRPMVLVRVTDTDGNAGWGEAWGNFPSPGAEHRARLIERILAPLACAEPWADATSLYRSLTARTEILAIQSGEYGPFAQTIAGIDTAVWDLLARQQGVPLWRLLGGAGARIRVYASGLNPTDPARLAAQCLEAGHRRFKLKIGFGRERDLDNMAALRRELGDDAALMADANQALTLDEALELAPRLEPFRLGWLEEPLRADRPWEEWNALRRACAIPLAAGENIAGDAAFDRALAAGALSVVQPDLAKWGGFSANRPLVARIAAAGLRYCPHYLGGGIGLLASGHLLAAAGGEGMLEIDANPNPLRSSLAGALATVEDGWADLGDAPGLGIEVELEALEQWRVAHDYA